MPLTTRTEIPAEYAAWYDRVLLDQSTPAYVYNRFAQVRDLPAGMGTDTVKFRKYGLLTAQTTALTEGVTPTGSQLSLTDVTATVLYYGDYVTLTDKVTIESIDPVLTETAGILGEQAGLTLDTLCRDVVAAGTTIQYASTATANNEITAAMKFTRAEAKEAVRTLRGNNAKPITNMIDPSTGYSTTPIGQSFVAICSEDTAFDLDDATGWIPVEKYPNKTGVMPDEIGALGNIRFVMTTQAYVESGAGAGGVDVHYTIVFAKNAYAQTRISGHAMTNIIKPLGSAGTADPLNQRQTSGWKAAYVAKILQQGWLVVVRHGVTG